MLNGWMLWPKSLLARMIPDAIVLCLYQLLRLRGLVACRLGTEQASHGWLTPLAGARAWCAQVFSTPLWALGPTAPYGPPSSSVSLRWPAHSYARMEQRHLTGPGDAFAHFMLKPSAVCQCRHYRLPSAVLRTMCAHHLEIPADISFAVVCWRARKQGASYYCVAVATSAVALMVMFLAKCSPAV